MVLGLSLVFCYIAITYFSSPNIVVEPIGKRNIIYSAPFFDLRRYGISISPRYQEIGGKVLDSSSDCLYHINHSEFYGFIQEI